MRNHKDTLITYIPDTLKKTTKIASFDFDSTLVKTKSKKKFAINGLDWTPWSSKIIPKLQSLHNNNYQIVIFTNQKGISTGKTKKEDVMQRLNDFAKLASIPIICLIATHDDHYRKPYPDMWYELTNLLPIKPVIDDCFYCGDAAGRKGDFSASDRQFAYNLDMQFYTPEVYFMYQNDVDYEWTDKAILDTSDTFDIKLSDTQEMIIMVGPPATGKSSVYHKYLSAYTRINMDTLKTKRKCISTCMSELDKGNSVVIDNTNPDKATRKIYIDLAKRHNIPIRCLVMNVSKDMIYHLNRYRLYKTGKYISRVVYNVYNKKYVRPNEDEGIEEIMDVPFVLMDDDVDDEFRMKF